MIDINTTIKKYYLVTRNKSYSSAYPFLNYVTLYNG